MSADSPTTHLSRLLDANVDEKELAAASLSGDVLGAATDVFGKDAEPAQSTEFPMPSFFSTGGSGDVQSPPPPPRLNDSAVHSTSHVRLDSSGSPIPPPPSTSPPPLNSPTSHQSTAVVSTTSFHQNAGNSTAHTSGGPTLAPSPFAAASSGLPPDVSIEDLTPAEPSTVQRPAYTPVTQAHVSSQRRTQHTATTIPTNTIPTNTIAGSPPRTRSTASSPSARTTTPGSRPPAANSAASRWVKSGTRRRRSMYLRSHSGHGGSPLTPSRTSAKPKPSPVAARRGSAGKKSVRRDVRGSPGPSASPSGPTATSRSPAARMKGFGGGESAGPRRFMGTVSRRRKGRARSVIVNRPRGAGMLGSAGGMGVGTRRAPQSSSRTGPRTSPAGTPSALKGMTPSPQPARTPAPTSTPTTSTTTTTTTSTTPTTTTTASPVPVTPSTAHVANLSRLLQDIRQAESQSRQKCEAITNRMKHIRAQLARLRDGEDGTTDVDVDALVADKWATEVPTSTDKPLGGSAAGTSGDKPSTDKPSTDKPSTDKPSTDKPSTDKPSTDKPSTDKPSGRGRQGDAAWERALAESELLSSDDDMSITSAASDASSSDSDSDVDIDSDDAEAAGAGKSQGIAACSPEATSQQHKRIRQDATSDIESVSSLINQVLGKKPAGGNLRPDTTLSKAAGGAVDEAASADAHAYCKDNARVLMDSDQRLSQGLPITTSPHASAAVNTRVDSPDGSVGVGDRQSGGGDGKPEASGKPTFNGSGGDKQDADDPYSDSEPSDEQPQDTTHATGVTRNVGVRPRVASDGIADQLPVLSSHQPLAPMTPSGFADRVAKSRPVVRSRANTELPRIPEDETERDGVPMNDAQDRGGDGGADAGAPDAHTDSNIVGQDPEVDVWEDGLRVRIALPSPEDAIATVARSQHGTGPPPLSNPNTSSTPPDATTTSVPHNSANAASNNLSMDEFDAIMSMIARVADHPSLQRSPGSGDGGRTNLSVPVDNVTSSRDTSGITQPSAHVTNSHTGHISGGEAGGNIRGVHMVGVRTPPASPLTTPLTRQSSPLAQIGLSDPLAMSGPSGKLTLHTSTPAHTLSPAPPIDRLPYTQPLPPLPFVDYASPVAAASPQPPIRNKVLQRVARRDREARHREGQRHGYALSYSSGRPATEAAVQSQRSMALPHSAAVNSRVPTSLAVESMYMTPGLTGHQHSRRPNDGTGGRAVNSALLELAGLAGPVLMADDEFTDSLHHDPVSSRPASAIPHTQPLRSQSQVYGSRTRSRSKPRSARRKDRPLVRRISRKKRSVSPSPRTSGSGSYSSKLAKSSAKQRSGSGAASRRVRMVGPSKSRKRSQKARTSTSGGLSRTRSRPVYSRYGQSADSGSGSGNGSGFGGIGGGSSGIGGGGSGIGGGSSGIGGAAGSSWAAHLSGMTQALKRQQALLLSGRSGAQYPPTHFTEEHKAAVSENTAGMNGLGSRPAVSEHVTRGGGDGMYGSSRLSEERMPHHRATGSPNRVTRSPREEELERELAALTEQESALLGKVQAQLHGSGRGRGEDDGSGFAVRSVGPRTSGMRGEGVSVGRVEGTDGNYQTPSNARTGLPMSSHTHMQQPASHYSAYALRPQRATVIRQFNNRNSDVQSQSTARFQGLSDEPVTLSELAGSYGTGMLSRSMVSEPSSAAARAPVNVGGASEDVPALFRASRVARHRTLASHN